MILTLAPEDAEYLLAAFALQLTLIGRTAPSGPSKKGPSKRRRGIHDEGYLAHQALFASDVPAPVNPRRRRVVRRARRKIDENLWRVVALLKLHPGLTAKQIRIALGFSPFDWNQLAGELRAVAEPTTKVGSRPVWSLYPDCC